MVLGLVAEAAGHAAADDSISSGLAPGISRSTSSAGCITPKAFWWQWPCTLIGRAGGAQAPARSGRLGLAGEELLEQEGLRGHGLSRLAQPMPQHLVAQAEQAGRLQADDGDARAAKGASAATRAAAEDLRASGMPLAR